MWSTILESLKGINPYPLPLRTIVRIAGVRGLNIEEEVSEAIIGSRAYKLATADIYCELAECPDVSQGGQNYSFTDEQRKALFRHAAAIYKEVGESNDHVRVTRFGYQGSRL